MHLFMLCPDACVTYKQSLMEIAFKVWYLCVLLSKKIEGVGWRLGKRDGKHKRRWPGQTNQKAEDVWHEWVVGGGGQQLLSLDWITGEDRGDDGINDLCQHILSACHFRGENSQNQCSQKCICRYTVIHHWHSLLCLSAEIKACLRHLLIHRT